MNQQSFASFVGIAPATLNGIFQERTRPTLNTVEAICKKMPNVNLMWLINGTGEMYVADDVQNIPGSEPDSDAVDTVHGSSADRSGMLDFSSAAQPSSISQQRPSAVRPSDKMNGNTRSVAAVDVKNIDKQARRITEIRVFYDDQTWESFVPKK